MKHLKAYHNHMRQHKKTLIAKVFGLFSIKFKLDITSNQWTKPFNVIVMENLNLIKHEDGKKVTYAVYDIKGSTDNR